MRAPSSHSKSISSKNPHGRSGDKTALHFFSRITNPGTGSSPSTDFRIRPALLAALLAATVILVFWPLTSYDFVNYDDPEYAASNWHVLGGLTFSNLRWAFDTGHAANWHPLTWLSLMLDVQLLGPGAAGHHLINVLFHAGNTVLLFVVLHAFTGYRFRSALVAALFAFHPLHVESVAWISERKDVLSTFFFLLALWSYSRFVKSPNLEKGSPAKPKSAGWRRISYYLVCLVFFAGSLLSKPMFVTLPFLLLLLDYWPLNRGSTIAETETPAPRNSNAQWTKYVLEKVPFLVLSALSCVVTLIVQTKGGAVRTLENLPMAARLENVPVAYVRYLTKTIWPVDLAVLYPHPGSWPWVTVAFCSLIVTGLSLPAWFLRRRFPYLLTGWFWFLGTLVPVIGLVQVGLQSIADRYTYVPLVGIFIIFAWGITEVYASWPLPQVRAALLATIVVILVVFATKTRSQLAVWSSSENLFRHAVAATKDNYMAMAFLDNTLGTSLYRRGKIDDAIEDFRSAIRLYPQYPLAWNNLGIALGVKGEIDQAIVQYERALQLAPDYAKAQVNLADAMVVKGRLPEAIDHYERALRIEPESVSAWNNLGSAFVRQGQYQKAVESYRQALFYSPKAARTHTNLGRALALQGRLEESMTNFSQALALEPNSPETHYQLAVLLIKLGRTAEAMDQLGEALRLRPDYPEALRELRSLDSQNASPKPANQ